MTFDERQAESIRILTEWVALHTPTEPVKLSPMSNSISPTSRANRPKVGTIFFWVSRCPFTFQSKVYEVKVTNPAVAYGVDRIEVTAVNPIVDEFDFNQWVWVCDLYDTRGEAEAAQ